MVFNSIDVLIAICFVETPSNHQISFAKLPFRSKMGSAKDLLASTLLIFFWRNAEYRFMQVPIVYFTQIVSLVHISVVHMLINLL